jgi:hypothetical protein
MKMVLAISDDIEISKLNDKGYWPMERPTGIPYIEDSCIHTAS